MMLTWILLFISPQAFAAEYRCPLPGDVGVASVEFGVWEPLEQTEVRFHFNSGLSSLDSCHVQYTKAESGASSTQLQCTGPSRLGDDLFTSITILRDDDHETVNVQMYRPRDGRLVKFGRGEVSKSCRK